jgi:hypothetical protein
MMPSSKVGICSKDVKQDEERRRESEDLAANSFARYY